MSRPVSHVRVAAGLADVLTRAHEVTDALERAGIPLDELTLVALDHVSQQAEGLMVADESARLEDDGR